MAAWFGSAFRRGAAAFRKQIVVDDFWSDVRRNASVFVRIGAVIHVIRKYGVEPTACVGASMLPTFNMSGDILLQEYPSVYQERIRVGDVVISKSPMNPRHVVCKRVLGLSGDVVHIPRTAQHAAYSVRVPEGHVWLQGDNTLNSTDSRKYGPVPYALLLGRAFFKVWPPAQAGWIENKIPSPTGLPTL